jgi:hypothetical protein
MRVATASQRLICILVTAIVLAVFVSLSGPYAAAPKFINYKATLTRPDGSPIPDTTYAMHFAIYRDETGGSAIWYEDHLVSTKNGDFHVKLGSVNSIADSVFADSLRYLGLTVNDDVEMAPRAVIGSVPWALNAHYAEKVTDKSIGKDQLKDKAVGADQLDSLAVDEDKIKGQAVGRDKLKDKAVGTNQLDSLAVDEGRIKDKAVGRDKLTDKAVGREQLDTLAVDAGRLMDDAVTSSKIADATIGFVDIGQNGAVLGQVMKWNGSSWAASDDETETGSGDSDWTLSGSVLFTGGGWGLARRGNELYGANDSTHVNLGNFSTTGSPSMEYAYMTIGGGFGNTAAGDFSTISGGSGNTSNGPYAAIGGGYSNDAGDPYSTIGGGYDNTIQGQYSVVTGGNENAAEGDYSFIGGGSNNTITNYNYATIGGGYNNSSDAPYAFIGGGGGEGPDEGNEALGEYSVIGGGGRNRTGDPSHTTGRYSFIGGGETNRAYEDFAVVCGGRDNRAYNMGTVIGGGEQNYASGQHATVPGGMWNEAHGDHSFAAGLNAKASHRGAVVISACINEMPGDSVISGGTAQIVLRADNGLYFTDSGGTAPDPTMSNRFIDTSTGAYLSQSGTWSNASDAALKENFTEIDPIEILDKISRLPVTQWNYKNDGSGIKHIGPTAQDFYRIFGIGEGERTTSTIDPAGVALAAIKALGEKTAELERKTDEIEELKRRLEDLTRTVEALADGRISAEEE